MLVNLNMRGVKLDSVATIALRQRLLATAKTIPGVENASLQITMPFWSQWNMSLYVAGIDTVGRLGQFDLNAVSPEYFSTIGTRILRGRDLGLTVAGDGRRIGIEGRRVTPWARCSGQARIP
jgi:hypothetical protein